MASESTAWDELRPLLKGLDPVRIENLVQTGTPDINYTHGWIELKYVRNWPSRGGPLRIDHFTPQQRVWLIRRHLAGGRVFVMIKVASEWLLIHGAVAAKKLGHVSQEQLYLCCVARWKMLPIKEDLQKWL